MSGNAAFRPDACRTADSRLRPPYSLPGRVKAFIMYYVNLMFLAMAGLIIFMALALVSNWLQGRKAEDGSALRDGPVPPRKPLSGRAMSEEAAVELNELLATVQRRTASVSPVPDASTMWMSLRTRKPSSATTETVPRIH